MSERTKLRSFILRALGVLTYPARGAVRLLRAHIARVGYRGRAYRPAPTVRVFNRWW